MDIRAAAVIGLGTMGAGIAEVLAARGLTVTAIEAVTGLASRLGKKPVAVGDRAGFVANAPLLPYLSHAVALLETGYASREDIDTAARAGLGLPIGPLALLDLIGLDTSQPSWRSCQASWAARGSGRPRCCAAWPGPA